MVIGFKEMNSTSDLCVNCTSSDQLDTLILSFRDHSHNILEGLDQKFRICR
uniref:Uncharacterized protein n=1 Tax=Rhizophora mucronata TaxID=61149 RepID=A0A2P2P3K3_RHIMU